MTPVRLALVDSLFEIAGPPDVLRQVEELFGARPATTAAATRRVEADGLDVLVDGALHTRARSRDHVVETVLMAVNATVIEDCASFSVHAGVVAGPAGAIAWPGQSGAGKSTLTAACLRAGFDYLSDEALVLQSGRARPYPKPLSLSAWSLSALGLPAPLEGTEERAVPYAELGALVPATPVPLAHVVVLHRQLGPARLVPAPAAGVAMLLLQHSFNHYKQPEIAFHDAARAAAGARCWRLSYDAPAQAAAVLRELLW